MQLRLVFALLTLTLILLKTVGLGELTLALDFLALKCFARFFNLL